VGNIAYNVFVQFINHYNINHSSVLAWVTDSVVK